MSLQTKLLTLEFMQEEIDRFLIEKSYAETTSVNYRYQLQRLNAWLSENRSSFRDLTPVTLNEYLKQQGWGNNAKRQAGYAAKAFLRWQYGASHPALSLKMPRDTSAPGRYLTDAQLTDLMAVFDTMTAKGWRDLSMIALMVESGLRAAEVCRLEQSHLNVQAHSFEVLAKGQKWRQGVFSQITAYYLDMWLAAREKIARRLVPYVFVSVGGRKPGNGMTSHGLRANFRKLGAKVESVRKLSPHDLRRTMAMLLIRNGAPTRMVQELGGWEDIRMVERYTRNLEPGQIDLYTPLGSNQLFK